MWGTLSNQKHVEFYKEFHAHSKDDGQDWMPMVRAVQHLQSLTVASDLYAFISLWRFHLTTTPTYEDCDGHYSLTVIWSWQERVFSIAFGRLAEGWVDDRTPEKICGEAEFADVIMPFIHRLLSRDSHEG